MIESQIVARVLPSKCREAVKVLLQEVYGYEDFRNLEVYDDLFKGKEKLQLSQGQLIEEVIMEAEKGIKGDSSVHNLLLTAPTGAGKSLLFQLPAIYLGNESVAFCFRIKIFVDMYQMRMEGKEQTQFIKGGILSFLCHLETGEDEFRSVEYQ